MDGEFLLKELGRNVPWGPMNCGENLFDLNTRLSLLLNSFFLLLASADLKMVIIREAEVNEVDLPHYQLAGGGLGWRELGTILLLYHHYILGFYVPVHYIQFAH